MFVLWDGNITTTITAIMSWGIILTLVIIVYRKQAEKVALWKILIAYIIGLVSFSISFQYFGEGLKIAILPLGVWLLFAVLYRRKSWQRYRKFAWLGFLSNFIFLGSALISIPIHHWIYPQNELNTFVADLSDAIIIVTHPSGNAQAQLIPQAAEALEQPQHGYIDSIEWYNELAFQEPTDRQEKFPYLLLGTTARWGSGYKPTVFLERDGKGLLITTEKKQLYFRTPQSLLSEVTSHD